MYLLVSSDFRDIPSFFTITLGPSTSISPSSFRIPIINDDILEGSEDFMAQLAPIGTLPPRVQFSNTVTNIIITDGDSKAYILKTRLEIVPCCNILLASYTLIRKFILEINNCITKYKSSIYRYNKHVLKSTIYFLDIAIGFSLTSYTFNEADNFATVDVEVTSGTLAIPVQVIFEVIYSDGTAVRKFPWENLFVLFVKITYVKC